MQPAAAEFPTCLCGWFCDLPGFKQRNLRKPSLEASKVRSDLPHKPPTKKMSSTRSWSTMFSAGGVAGQR